MAALRVVPPACVSLSTPHRVHRRGACGAGRRAVVVLAAHTVTVEHRGKTHTLTLDDDTTILEAALDAGVDLPHDCKARVGTAVALWLGAHSPVSTSRAQRCGLRPAAAAASLCGGSVWRCCGSKALTRVRQRVSSGASATHSSTLFPPPHPDGRLHDLPSQACEVRTPEGLAGHVCRRQGATPCSALTHSGGPRLLAFSAAVRLTRAAAACLATTCRRRALCCSAAAGQWVTAR
jgi:hypothetical protein